VDTTSDINSILAAGAGAAGLLEAACSRESEASDEPRIGLVRELAKDIKDQLEALARLTKPEPSPDFLAEAALRCADLANLAACNLDGLPAAEAARAAASVHLAAGAIRALQLLAEGAPDNPSGSEATVLRDVRGAGWRADLAVRQVEELLEAATEG
jgi:hypothetical protein